jgi:prepilin-type N-terminal cleavage/methylation domain-containing protein
MDKQFTLLNNSKGFTLLEIAIVMVLIGILTGGGISLMKILTERKTRNVSVEYLQQVRSTLISFAENNGRLPWADGDGDGDEDNGTSLGSLPYLTLQIRPVDAYTRVLRYEVNAQLTTNRTTSCTALRAGLARRPAVVDADGATNAFSVAFVLVSAGPMDADGNGNVLDDINSGTHQGNNANGNPNYLRHPPLEGTFDDLTAYLGGNELFAGLCEYLSLAVNNSSGTTVYVYNVNQASDLGAISTGNSGLYSILSGTRVELRSAANGGGSLVSSSTPPTPIVLAGQGATINVP